MADRIGNLLIGRKSNKSVSIEMLPSKPKEGDIIANAFGVDSDVFQYSSPRTAINGTESPVTEGQPERVAQQASEPPPEGVASAHDERLERREVSSTRVRPEHATPIPEPMAAQIEDDRGLLDPGKIDLALTVEGVDSRGTLGVPTDVALDRSATEITSSSRPMKDGTRPGEVPQTATVIERPPSRSASQESLEVDDEAIPGVEAVESETVPWGDPPLEDISPEMFRVERPRVLDEAYVPFDLDSLRKRRTVTTREISRLRRDLVDIHGEVNDIIYQARLQRRRHEERLRFLLADHRRIFRSLRDRGVLDDDGRSVSDDDDHEREPFTYRFGEVGGDEASAAGGSDRFAYRNMSGRDGGSPHATERIRGPNVDPPPPSSRVPVSSFGPAMAPITPSRRDVDTTITGWETSDVSAAPTGPVSPASATMAEKGGRSRRTTEETAVEMEAEDGQVWGGEEGGEEEERKSRDDSGPELVIHGPNGTTTLGLGLGTGRIASVLREKASKRAPLALPPPPSAVPLKFWNVPGNRRMVLDAYGADVFVRPKGKEKKKGRTEEERREMFYAAYGADSSVRG
ncbi:hypothetical protein HDU93_002002 [Gonapodya sp. JEL0774]|nr:hypothetical protein HDU93_002002 [Gonapodya sp. JEL0774]